MPSESQHIRRKLVSVRSVLSWLVHNSYSIHHGFFQSACRHKATDPIFTRPNNRNHKNDLKMYDPFKFFSKDRLKTTIFTLLNSLVPNHKNDVSHSIYDQLKFFSENTLNAVVSKKTNLLQDCLSGNRFFHSISHSRGTFLIFFLKVICGIPITVLKQGDMFSSVQ